MKHRLLVSATLAMLLTACSNLQQQGCSEVASFKIPDKGHNLYPVMILNIDGNPISPKAFYRLTPGVHSIMVAELVSAAKLDVALKYRVPKSLVISVDEGYRYHFAALFNDKLLMPAKNDKFWEPVVWKKEEVFCEQQGKNKE